MQHLDTYTPPDAPLGSSGWVIEAEFVGVQTGTGNIGAYQLIGTLPNTIAGCPVYVSFRYLCVNSAVVPDGGGTALQDFLEIAETTLNEDQLTTLEKIQEAIGLEYPTESWFDIYYNFNVVFLSKNPDYELDLSGLGLSDVSLLDTLTNLRHVNLNDNKINGYSLQQIDRLNLVTMKMQRNALGMNDLIFLVPMNSSLKHIDVSENNIQEVRLFSGFDLDYLDLSDNVIASIDSNTSNKVKDFRFNRNVYPDTVGFWATRKADSTSATKIANNLGDMSQIINFELADYELNDPVNDPTTIINTIASDKGITFAEAEALTNFAPTWEDVENSVGHVPYDPTVLK